MNAEDVKLINKLPLEDNSQDETLNKLIEVYQGIAEEYCNRVFEDSLPYGVKKFIAESIKYGTNGNLASRSMGTVSYSFVTDLPQSVYKHLAPFRKLRW